MTQPIHPMLFAMADAMLDAIRKEHVYVNCVDGDPAHTVIDGGTFDFTLVARAAIQALLEVDASMVEAGNAAGGEAYQYQQFGVVVCPPAKAFQAMLKPLLGDEG